MSYITLLAGLMQGTVRRLNGEFNIFNTNEQQLGLANRVTGQENFGQLLNIFQQDKALTLNRIKQGFNVQFASAQEAYYQKKLEQENQRRQKAAESGFLA